MARDAMTIQDVLNNATAPLRAVGVADALAEQMARLTNQLQQLQGASQAAGESTKGNTLALASSTTSKIDVARASLTNPVLSSVGLGLGLSPLITGIARLFGGGGGSEEIPPLVKFGLPDPVHLNAGVSDGIPGPFVVDSGQGGLPRAVTAPPQITVQVQAMDSRSFLDHSGEIAMAVRQAMLESSVLNDVIRGV
jgi:hypothetical protein